MNLERLIDFSVAEFHLMQLVEVPLEQQVSPRVVMENIKTFDLSETDKKELTSRVKQVFHCRTNLRKYAKKEPSELFKLLFGRVPHGEITITFNPYHLTVQAYAYREFDDLGVELGRSTCGVIAPKNNIVRAPELRGLVEIRTSDNFGMERLIANIFGQNYSDGAKHEREHVRQNMVVRGGKSYLSQWNTSPMPYIDFLEGVCAFYESYIRGEAGAELAERRVPGNQMSIIERFKERTEVALQRYRKLEVILGIKKRIDQCQKEYDEFFLSIASAARGLWHQLGEQQKTSLSEFQRVQKAFPYVLTNTTLFVVQENFKEIYVLLSTKL